MGESDELGVAPGGPCRVDRGGEPQGPLTVLSVGMGRDVVAPVGGPVQDERPARGASSDDHGGSVAVASAPALNARGPSAMHDLAQVVGERVRLAAMAAVATGQGIVLGVVAVLGPVLFVLTGVRSVWPSRFEALEARLHETEMRLAQAELGRIGRLTGVELPPPSHLSATDVGALARTRRLLYWLLRGPVSFLHCWALGLAVAVPALGVVGSVGGLRRDPQISAYTEVFGSTMIGPRWSLAVGAASLMVVVVAGWCVPGWLLRLDAAMARILLSGTDTDALAESVERLETSRAQVVDSADAERRRIERDLHDGAQQRLVALSMVLGRAQARLGPDDDPTLSRLLAEARTETTAAIGEIRDLTRGLHPPVLTDRGLDAALSAVAARSPIPVDVSVDLPTRPSITIESVVYFAVTEALANVAKHARASRCRVRIEQVETPARVAVRAVVIDDGVGGADPSRGSGLHGLVDRLAGVDGSMELTSPVGGPTELVVIVPWEAPCVS